MNGQWEAGWHMVAIRMVFEGDDGKDVVMMVGVACGWR